MFLWFAMLYNSFVMIYIRRYLNHLEQITIMKNDHFYQKIKYFPLVLTLWWTFPTIHRIYQMVYETDVFFLGAIHVFCESSYGFANMILYAMNPRIKHLISERIKQIFKRKNKEKNNEKIQEKNNEKNQEKNKEKNQEKSKEKNKEKNNEKNQVKNKDSQNDTTINCTQDDLIKPLIS